MLDQFSSIYQWLIFCYFLFSRIDRSSFTQIETPSTPVSESCRRFRPIPCRFRACSKRSVPLPSLNAIRWHPIGHEFNGTFGTSPQRSGQSSTTVHPSGPDHIFATHLTIRMQWIPLHNAIDTGLIAIGSQQFDPITSTNGIYQFEQYHITSSSGTT